MLTPRQVALYLGIALALIGSGIWIGASAGAKHYAKKAEAAQTKSDQHDGAARDHAARAVETDQQATKQQATVNAADAQVAAAKRELDRRLAALHGDAPASISTGDTNSSAPFRAIPRHSGDAIYPEFPDNSNSPKIPDSSIALAAAEQVIAAQDHEIAALKLQVSIEHASAVQWHQAYDQEAQALALERIAKDAAVHAERNRGVKGQFIRGLEGFALGYVAGRVTR